MAVIDVTQVRPASAGDYIALLKPRVMSLVVFTGLVGYMAAPGPGDIVLGFAAILSIAVAAGGSFVAGTVSVVGLMLLAPPLAEFALRFGPPENFALLVLGLLVLAYMSGG